jgi:nucleolin
MSEDTKSSFVDISEVLNKDQKTSIDWADMGPDDDEPSKVWDKSIIEDNSAKSLADIQAEQEKDDKRLQDQENENNKKSDKYVPPRRSNTGFGGDRTSGSGDRDRNPGFGDRTSGSGYGRGGGGGYKKFPKNTTIPDRPPFTAKIDNLEFSVNDEELRKVFENIGYIKSARVMTDRESGKSRGFGFVEFESAEDLKAALERNDDIKGRRIDVSVKMESQNRGGEYGTRDNYNKSKYTFNDRNNDRNDRNDRNRSPPKERKKLVLAPKSEKNTTEETTSSKDSIFGKGKAANTEYKYDESGVNRVQKIEKSPENNRRFGGDRDRNDNRSRDSGDNRKFGGDRESGDNRKFGGDRNDQRNDNRSRDSGDNRRFGGDRNDQRNDQRNDNRRSNNKWEKPDNNHPQKSTDGFQVRGGKKKVVARTNPVNNATTDNKEETDPKSFITENKFSLLMNE